MGLFKRTPKTPPVDPAEVAELRRQIEELNARLHAVTSVDGEHARRLDELDGKVISLGARVTQVGTEVTHQLGELSGDIDKLGARTDEIASTIGDLPEQVDAVRSDQARLANEQARYEIRFSQDLAEVADIAMKKR
jgi:chromosome segregation ATPase